jgi:hypothetical protein
VNSRERASAQRCRTAGHVPSADQTPRARL